MACLFQAMNVDSSSILLRPSDFYQQYGIEVWTQKEVRNVDLLSPSKGKTDSLVKKMFCVAGGVGGYG